MATARQRTQVTHTDDVEHALHIAMRRWPDEKRPSALLVLLAKEGAKSIEVAVDLAAASRRRDVDEVAAEFAGIYPEGYLDSLRGEWPE